MRSVENEECGKYGVGGNALTLTDLFQRILTYLFNIKKCLEMLTLDNWNKTEV